MDKSFITHYGKVECDIEPLIEAVKSIPLSEWKYRIDPESEKTRVIREGDKLFPGDLAKKIIEKAGEDAFGKGYSNRVVLSCVPAGEGILPHTDDFGEAVKSKSFHCHIPLITSREAIMGFSELEKEIHLEQGHLYSMDETKEHYVKNPSSVDRVHLLFAWFPHAGKSLRQDE